MRAHTNTHTSAQQKTPNNLASHRSAFARSQWVNIYYVKAFTDFCGEMVCHCVVSYYTLHSMLLLWWSATAVAISFLFMQCNVSMLIPMCECVCACVYLDVAVIIIICSCPLGCWLNKISRVRVSSLVLFLFHIRSRVRAFARSFSTFSRLKCA